MRPVIRGDCPQNAAGQYIQFSDYANARKELIARLGEYCSYCEMQLDASLAVEHVQPKQPPGSAVVMVQRALSWDNFLLACTNCNSTKSNTDVVLNDYLWPDRDNTFKAIKYTEGGVVSSVADVDQVRANKLIQLVGLDKMPDTQTASDRRWLNRKEAWDMATRAKERLCRSNSNEMKDQITETVQAKGYWSIWMTVFKDDADMLSRFIAIMPGTDTTCFDATNGYIPTNRVGGFC